MDCYNAYRCANIRYSLHEVNLVVLLSYHPIVHSGLNVLLEWLDTGWSKKRISHFIFGITSVTQHRF